MNGRCLEVIPAVDVRHGQAVRLFQGDPGSETRYGDPLRAALTWQRAGARWLHVVDLDAAFAAGNNRRQIAEMIALLDLPVQLSGGIRTEEDLAAALATGCARVILGTAAQENPRWVADAVARYGDRIVVSLDVRGRTVQSRGWTRPGGDLYETLARMDAAGCSRYLVTDIERDGTLSGPNLDLLAHICEATDRPVIAAGGISSLSDLRWVASLTDTGVEAAVVGRALYARSFSLQRALDAVSTPHRRTGPNT